MFRAIQITLVVVASCAVAGVAQAGWVNPTTWDILSEDYGNGAGQVSFLGAYAPAWSTDPTETLSNGKATVTLPAGTGINYQTKATIAGMVTGNANYTMEYKLAATAKSEVDLFASETNSYSTSSWNHIIQLNGVYNGHQDNALVDYNWGKETGNRDSSQAPAGFDGGIAHTYRLVRDTGVTSLYLDGNVTPAITMAAGSSGASADSMNLFWGFAQNASQSVGVDMYYLRIANGTFVPEPSSLSMLCAGVFGLVAYAWRKRR
jgi:hypothetical protein